MNNLKFEVKYARAGFTTDSLSRPTFTIYNICTITIPIPRWYRRLMEQRKISSRDVEYNWRLLKSKIEKLDLEIIEASLYTKYSLKVKSILDGHPDDARKVLKGTLRLLYAVVKEFFNVFRYLVAELPEYIILANGRIVFCPTSVWKRNNIKKLDG